MNKGGHTSILWLNFSETFMTLTMLDKLNGSWPSSVIKENIVAARPLPYENITTRLFSCKSREQSWWVILNQSGHIRETVPRKSCIRDNNRTLPVSHAYCEGEMQVLHKVMQCTYYQLVLELMLWALPSHSIKA